jgi:thioredoxin 1
MKRKNARLIFMMIFVSMVSFSFMELQRKNHKNAPIIVNTERNIENLNYENFSDFVSGDLVLVDFWAPWCPPCRLQNPILEELNEEMGSIVKIGKVNVDDNRALSSTYGIVSIPTILIFKNGKVLERLTGLQQKNQLSAIINKYKD